VHNNDAFKKGNDIHGRHHHWIRAIGDEQGGDGMDLDDASNKVGDTSYDTVVRPEQRPGRAFAQIPINHVTTAAVPGPVPEVGRGAASPAAGG
jgi:hypothetical protein